MAKLGISVLNTQGENEYWVRGEDEIHLVYPKEYELGDTLVFTSDEVPGFYVIRVDGAIVAQMVNALYNIVDRIYIGHIADVGDIALTGLGLCFPIIMFVSALAALVGIGGGSRASILMGDGDQHGANEILGNCAVLMLMIPVGSTALFQLTKEPLLCLFGASGNTIP